MKKLCLVCAKEFIVKPHRIKEGYGKFCSQKCCGVWKSKYKSGTNSTTWKGGKIERMCLTCSKPFKLNRCLAKRGGKFCSYKCMGVWQSRYRVGKNSPSWKGGPIKRNCVNCKKEFFADLARVKRGYGIFCSLSCVAIWRTKHQNKKSTVIEVKVEKYLKQLGVKFESQKMIPKGRTVADFYIPEKRLVVYADGTYWHGRKEVKNRDQKQDFLLGMNGYKVLRLSEKEIRNGKFMKKLRNKIITKGG